MCTVLYYRYTCGHSLARRPSRCGGTRCKITRSGRKAACTAEGYITIRRQTVCNTCLKDQWVARWQGRLDKARRFHEGLAERGSPGASEVRGLVEELEERYEVESWELKNVIPYGDRARVRRVDPGDDGRERKGPGSPLRFEVRPEEVVVRVVAEPVVYDEGDGWVPSTDPLHPVTTDYEVCHPGVDAGFLESLVREDGYGEELGYGGFDSIAAKWSWDGGEATGAERGCGENGWNDLSTSSPDLNVDPVQDDEDSKASRPGADHTLPPDEDHTDELPAREGTHLEQIEETIAAFWKAVNTDDSSTASQPSSKPQPSDPVTAPTNTSNGDANADINSTSTLRYSLTDGPSDPSPLTPPESQHQSSPRLVSAAKYNRFREALLPLKEEDPKKYYGQWLVECRLEIREVVGPDGPKVYDPPRKRAW